MCGGPARKAWSGHGSPPPGTGTALTDSTDGAADCTAPAEADSNEDDDGDVDDGNMNMNMNVERTEVDGTAARAVKGPAALQRTALVKLHLGTADLEVAERDPPSADLSVATVIAGQVKHIRTTVEQPSGPGMTAGTQQLCTMPTDTTVDTANRHVSNCT